MRRATVCRMSCLEKATKEIVRRLSRLRFGDPVAYVYQPLEYARRPHAEYLRRYGQGSREVLLLGMNPGPFGMAQTGVPFGEIAAVRDWLGIEATVDRPAKEHPKRPIEGFACRRSEVSGRRLWGWAAERWRSPERFFARFYVHNYCPLAFLEDSGRNRTPDKLPVAEREPLHEACNDHLRAVVECLSPEWIVGVGAFAETQARKVFGDSIRIGRIPHPSPASPAANKGWEPLVDQALADLGLA